MWKVKHDSSEMINYIKKLNLKCLKWQLKNEQEMNKEFINHHKLCMLCLRCQMCELWDLHNIFMELKTRLSSLISCSWIHHLGCSVFGVISVHLVFNAVKTLKSGLPVELGCSSFGCQISWGGQCSSLPCQCWSRVHDLRTYYCSNSHQSEARDVPGSFQVYVCIYVCHCVRQVIIN